MRTSHRRKEVVVVGLGVWVLLLTGMVVIESIGLVRPNDAWPTLSDMLRVVTRSQIGRWITFALWLWFGWHLFIRGWDFFLRGVPLGESAPSKGTGSPSGPITFADVARGDIGPLVVFYLAALVCLMAYGRRILRGAVVVAGRAAHGSTELLRHVAGTAIGGYAAFLFGTTLYYALVERKPRSFLAEALWGGAFLAFCVAVPVFVLLVHWIYGRGARNR